MIGIDTNVLLRYIVQDDPEQTAKSRAFFNQLTPDMQGWIALVTLAELVWVLRTTYDAPRSRIAAVVKSLLNAQDLDFERRDSVVEALAAFHAGKADFADCLIVACNHAAGCTTTVTLDRTAAKLKGMRLL